MTSTGRRILIVDDDPEIVRLIERSLARSFEVTVAYCGAEALEILEEESEGAFDAILADHMMPEITGIDLLRRCLSLQPDAARLLVTSSHEPQVAHDAINLARAHRILMKPFGLSELGEFVSSAIREVELERELRQKNDLLNQALGALRENEAHLEREITVRTRALMMANSELARLAMRDGLTDLHNHRYFQDLLRAEVASATTYDRPLSLLFVDVDHFKAYNDRLGHQAGDAVLQAIAKILSTTRDESAPELAGRSADNVARYGGDEFVMSLPETEKSGALARAERIRKAVERWHFPDEELAGTRISVSIGVASLPEDAKTRESLIEAADQAMLLAKRLGGNRIQGAGDYDIGEEDEEEALATVGPIPGHNRRH
ncbi:MAG: diguanylate cyclase [Deltaproteobacteria bacterium]|nr:diguanylate cyclase [Deltaproteobacteria bacterium]